MQFVVNDVKVGDRVLPADSLAVYHIFDAHKDPSVYKQPETYDPSRFERGEASKPHEYLGWGSGRRA